MRKLGRTCMDSIVIKMNGNNGLWGFVSRLICHFRSRIEKIIFDKLLSSSSSSFSLYSVILLPIPESAQSPGKIEVSA